MLSVVAAGHRPTNLMTPERSPNIGVATSATQPAVVESARIQIPLTVIAYI